MNENRNLTRLTFGIGYNSGGIYVKTIKDIKTPEYVCWQSMLRRCYDPKYIAKQPTYEKITVCNEWLDFQVFAKWHEENKLLNFELDKDFLIKGNTIYHPEACCFIPKEINSILLSCKSRRGHLPIGVIKQLNRYRVRISILGQQKNLGYFDTPELAFQAYKEAKEKHIKFVATQYVDVLRDDVYQILMNYEININD